MVLEDPSKPDWWEPDTRGIAWNIHEQGKMNIKDIDNIKYDIYNIEEKQ